MRTTLRKVGNSSAVIIPKPLLKQIGVESGDDLEMLLEKGRIILLPVKQRSRNGWAEAAKKIAHSGDDALVWPEFGNADDEALQW